MFKGTLQSITNNKLLQNFKNAGLYFFGSILHSIFALIAQPIYSRHLAADDFGLISYFDAIKNVFTPIFIFSITSVYLMQYFKQSEAENKKTLFNLSVSITVLNTLTIVVAYVLIYLYFNLMGVNFPLYPFVWYVLIALLLDNIKSFVLINFRIRKKALSFFLFSAINTSLNFGIGILFVASFKWGAEGRMLAPVISTIIVVPYCIYILKKYTTVYLNLQKFYEAIKTATPLVLAAYAYVPITTMDRFFLERLNNHSELGLYSIGVLIAGYVQLAYNAIGAAFEPDIFKFVVKKNHKKLAQIAMAIFIPYLIFIIVFMFFSKYVIYYLTDGKFMAAEQYTNVALIAVYLMGWYWFLNKIFIALGKTKINLLVNSIGGLSAIIIMYFGANYYGYLGAAYGKIAISSLLVIVSIYYVLKYLKLNLKSIEL